MVKSFFLIIIISLIFFPVALAATPSYNIQVVIKDKNIVQNQTSPFTIYIKGGGECNQAYVTYLTEGIMYIDNLTTIYSKNRAKIETFDEPKNIEAYEIQGKKACITTNVSGITVGQLRDDLSSIFKNYKGDNYMEIETYGLLRTLEKSEGGQYDLIAIFSCYNGGIWYNFENKQSVKVMLPGEETQFQFALAAFLISAISLIISYIEISRRK